MNIVESILNRFIQLWLFDPLLSTKSDASYRHCVHLNQEGQVLLCDPVHRRYLRLKREETFPQTESSWDLLDLVLIFYQTKKLLKCSFFNCVSLLFTKGCSDMMLLLSFLVGMYT